MAFLMAAVSPLAAQVAGSAPPSGLDALAPPQAGFTADGWSARQSILGRQVFDDAGRPIGRVEDLIVDPGRNVSYLMVGVGARVGRGWHVVAVPAAAVVMQSERMVLPGATRASLAERPAFRYAPITRTQSQTVARAEQDTDAAHARIAVLTSTLSAGMDSAARARVQRQIADLQTREQAVQDKMAQMRSADARHWQGLEVEVGQASERLRAALKHPVD